MKHNIQGPSLLVLALAFTMQVNAQKVVIDHYSTAKIDCAIFPDTYPVEVDGKSYTPSHDDVDNAEKALQDKLKTIKCDKKDDRDEVVKNLDKYKIQVFGYIDKAGNKMLFLNCVRTDYKDKGDKDLSTMWLTDIVQVQGGGTYFWTVKYDLGRGELSEFKLGGNNN
jgi:hypothetical protein